MVWGGNVWPGVVEYLESPRHNWNGTDPVDIAFFDPADNLFRQHEVNSNGMIGQNLEFFGVEGQQYFCVPRVCARLTRVNDTITVTRLTFN